PFSRGSPKKMGAPDGLQPAAGAQRAGGEAQSARQLPPFPTSRLNPSRYDRAMATKAAKNVEKRAAELRDLLAQWGHAYHVLDEPIVEDAAYDRAYDELVELENEHPELVRQDSPTQRVGAPPSEKFQKVEHLMPMGSLDKVTTDEALFKWAEDMRKRLDRDEPLSYVIEPKIDGLAISLTYENRALARA